MNPLIQTANINEKPSWQDRIHRVRSAMVGLATEEGELLEREMRCRLEFQRIEQEKKFVEEQRQRFKAEVESIETELGLTTDKIS